jgi:hypothetical protein
MKINVKIFLMKISSKKLIFINCSFLIYLERQLNQRELVFHLIHLDIDNDVLLHLVDLGKSNIFLFLHFLFNFSGVVHSASSHMLHYPPTVVCIAHIKSTVRILIKFLNHILYLECSNTKNVI